MENYYISLFDKVNRRLSEKVPLLDIIYNQNEVEFMFNLEDTGTQKYETLSYKDFLFWQEDFEVCLEYDNPELLEKE